MSADLRRFHDPLEPLRRQRQGQLDLWLARLGKIQQRIQRQREHLASLEVERAERSQEIGIRFARCTDPIRLAMDLRWLAQLQDTIREARLRLEELIVERSAIQAQCVECQMKVDVLEAHRREALQEYAVEENRRMAGEMDRDWISRKAGARRKAFIAHRRRDLPPIAGVGR